MTCRLRKNTAPLRNSHVIPELYFKPVYDEKHGAMQYSIVADSHGYIQNGFRE
jgi:hypothetical protein